MTVTILVAKVVPKDGNKPFKVLDENGTDYAIWDAALAQKAETFLGKMAEVEIEVKQRTSEQGRVFVNRSIRSIEPSDAPEVAPANRPSNEPSINTGKQIVIIRQNAWSQANSVYDKAVSLYLPILSGAQILDPEAIHTIAFRLVFGDKVKRPEGYSMKNLVSDIEKAIREHWFPITEDEIPF